MAPPITLRGSDGIWMVNGPPTLGSRPDFPGETSSKTKVVVFSSDGALIAWCNGESVKVLKTSDYQQLWDLPHAKVQCMKFSPKGSILLLWENYSVNSETQQGNANLHIYNMQSGKLLKNLIQKKQANWDPVWTNDEGICCRNVNNELHFFENNDFDSIKTKLHMQKVSSFSLAVSGPPYYVAGYVPGSKGQPSFIRLYKYPNFGGLGAAIANRSFYKAEDVKMLWNNAGTALLALTSTELSDQSYYGDQGLHYMNINGDACLVPRSKNGPIYNIAWSPKSTEFCVVYGFMPAKATLYNMKTEPIFDFGTGPRNCCFYNPQGNILCLAGFGNLRGNLEFWDVKQKRMITQTQSPDTTSFEWCPDGEHILTSTCSPRLRVANGYRVWHYTGTLLQQVLLEQNHELWETAWQPAPKGAYPERPIRYGVVQAPVDVPQPDVKQKAYRPPQARGTEASVKLHEYEAASDPTKKLNPGHTGEESKAAIKNRKKREARKAKSAQEDGQAETEATASVPGGPSLSDLGRPQLTGNPEVDKKIKNLNKKLSAIQKLKEQQQAGKPLEKNQLDKLKTEESLLKELKDLKIT
ncbi:eukaryotic translation initiation factor 2A-like [Mytilus galloprovincialis]|uniref:eukaryotic translation initiation factor 2A-like n=1 Tax=Mytilus galloprovincialis TaxID=29158 RepID=UPI003F7B4BF9